MRAAHRGAGGGAAEDDTVVILTDWIRCVGRGTGTMRRAADPAASVVFGGESRAWRKLEPEPEGSTHPCHQLFVVTFHRSDRWLRERNM